MEKLLLFILPVLWWLVYIFLDYLFTRKGINIGTYYLVNSIVWLCYYYLIYFRSSNYSQLSYTNIWLIILCSTLAIVAHITMTNSIKFNWPTLTAIMEVSYPFFVIFLWYIIFGKQLNIYTWLWWILIFIWVLIVIKYGW